jgi:hypothetical protein
MTRRVTLTIAGLNTQRGRRTLAAPRETRMYNEATRKNANTAVSTEQS